MYSREELEEKGLKELRVIGKDLGVFNYTTLEKPNLIVGILKKQSQQPKTMEFQENTESIKVKIVQGSTMYDKKMRIAGTDTAEFYMSTKDYERNKALQKVLERVI